MKKLYHDIALQTGGSHYPNVGGELLEKFADNLVNTIIKEINEAPLQEIVRTTWDNDFSTGIKEAIIKHIQEVVNEDLQ